MNRRLLIATAVIAVIVISCGKGKKPDEGAALPSAVTTIDKGFSSFIAGYTTGVVPANSSLQVVFTPEFAATIDRSRTQGLFTFTPAVKGDAEWADDVTLVFTPSKPLPPGTSFQGTLDLGKLGQAEERFRLFPLSFRTVEKNFTVTVNPVTVDPPDGNTYTLTGTVVTSDYIDGTEVEKYLSARIGRRDENIIWDHENKNIHSFSIEKINREKEERQLTVAWNGTSFGVKTKGEHVITIPASGVFTVTDIRVNAGDSKSIEIFFSDLLDAGSELDGIDHHGTLPSALCQCRGQQAACYPRRKYCRGGSGYR